jgi:hypothetical protein
MAARGRVSVPKSHFRLDFIGLTAFLVEAQQMYAVLVHAEKAAVTPSPPQHFPTLLVARYAIDPTESDLPPIAATEDWAIYSLAGASVEFAQFDGNGKRLCRPLKTNRQNGPKTSGACPGKGAWNDFDWVLDASELTNAKPDKTWRTSKSGGINCVVEISGGAIEDPGLPVDIGQFVYQFTIGSRKRALKDVVRYTLDTLGPSAGVVDIVVTAGGAKKKVRCALDNPDPGGSGSARLGAYAQIIHMPAVPVHAGGPLTDLRSVFALTDASDLNAINVPTPTTDTCAITRTSECGCCPPVAFFM